MVFQAGNVSSFAELFPLLRTFITGDPGTPGRDWTEELYQNSKDENALTEPFGSNCKETVYSNVGLSGIEHIIVGFREWYYVAGGGYGWDLNCYTSWTTGQQWNGNANLHGRTIYDSTWERWANHPQLPLLDGTMYYWFFSNKQRIIVVVRTSAQFQSCYVGFGNRLALPSEYPYPLVAIGSFNGGLTQLIYSDQSASHSYIADPYIGGDSCPFVVSPAGVYSTILASFGNLEFIPSVATMSFGGMLIGKAMDGRVMTWPLYIRMEGNILMMLDDVQVAPLPSIASEDILVIDAEEWIVFQNIHRITWYSYMAINSKGASTFSTTSTTTTTTTTTTTSSSSSTTTTLP